MKWKSAEAMRGRVESDLAVDVGVVGVEIRGVWYLRVVATGFESEAHARDLVAKARGAGFPDAWYLVDPGRRSSIPDETPASPESPAQMPAGAESVRPVESARSAAPETADRPPTAETSGGRFTGALKFATSPDGGETVEVPRYDAVDLQLDGRLDEIVWSEVPGHDNMVLVEPGTLAKARHRTIARYFYTERGLYIGVWNEQPRRSLAAQGNPQRTVPSLDAWGITLDTSGDGRHGHWFNIALGTAAERGPGDGPPEPSWRYATAALRDGWSLEAFVPWSSLALASVEEDRVVGMYVNRRVVYLNERWGWPASLTPTR